MTFYILIVNIKTNIIYMLKVDKKITFYIDFKI